MALSESRKRANAKWQKTKAKNITIQYTNSDYEKIEKYMNKIGAESRSAFIKSAINYAMRNGLDMNDLKWNDTDE